MPNYPLRDDATDEQRLHLEVVLDPKTAAELLTHAADLLDRVARVMGSDLATPEITRWFQDFTDFRDAR